MSKVSISEAARLAKISRTHFYRRYIQEGLVSVSIDDNGKRYIDVSELLRVFKSLQMDVTYVSDGNTNLLQKDSYVETLLMEKIKGLEALLKAREEELDGYREREKSIYRLLEHKPSKKKRWWQLPGFNA